MGQIVNATAARSIGIRGYVTTTVENHTGLLTIPATGNITVTVDLWFVSYDKNITQTNVTVNPKVSYEGTGEWFSFAAACEPNGNITLRVNEPTWLQVTLWIPEYVGHGIGLGGNYGADLVDVRSSYTIIGTDFTLDNWSPRIRVVPENVTTQDEVVLSIFNPGPSLISLYYAYDLDRLENGTWVPVVLDSTWTRGILFWVLGILGVS